MRIIGSILTLIGVAMEVYLITMVGIFLGNDFIFGSVIAGILFFVIAFYWFFMQAEYELL
jgi:hypothetical protein